MGVTVKGDAELIATLNRLDKTVDRKARKATKDGAQVFKDDLQAKTPRAPAGADHSGMTPLAEHVKLGNIKASTGDYSVDVGYDKEKGWIAHFPNSGTAKQRPQHFIERSIEASRRLVLMKYIEDLKL